MKQSQQVLGLPIMGMKEGLTRGIAVDLLIDAEQKKVLYIILKNAKGYGFRMLSIDDILGVGADYIMTASTENAKVIFSCPDLLQSLESGFFGSDLLNAAALSTSGNTMANVQEFSFDDETGDLVALFLEDGSEYAASDIAVLSRDIVFLNAAHPIVEATVPVETVVEAPAAVQSDEASTQESAPFVQPELTVFQQAQRAFLIGHTVTADITDKSGEVIISSGTIVTEEIVQLAEQHDLSTDLALNVN